MKTLKAEEVYISEHVAFAEEKVRVHLERCTPKRCVVQCEVCSE